jgi:membrane-associated phospholipid phosphatase
MLLAKIKNWFLIEMEFSVYPRLNQKMFLIMVLMVVFIGISLIHFSCSVQEVVIEKAIFATTTRVAYSVYRRITMAGEAMLLIPFSLLMIALWLLKKQWLWAIGMVISVMGGSLLTLFLKILFRSERPNLVTGWIEKIDFGYPSGHAVISILFWGYLGIMLIKYMSNIRLKYLVGIVTILIPLMVGISRLLLGVHFPTDVLGGWVLGGIWLNIVFIALAYLDGILKTRLK